MDPKNIDKQTLLIIDTVNIFIYVVIFCYLHKLEKENCACANSPKAKFIKYYSLFMIVLLIISMFEPKIIFNQVSHLFINVFNVINIFFLFTYIRKLERDNCVCAVDDKPYTFEFLKIYSLVVFYVLILSFVILVSMGIGYGEFPKYGKISFKDINKSIVSKKRSLIRSTRRKNRF
jgi:hypothetical protein